MGPLFRYRQNLTDCSGHLVIIRFEIIAIIIALKYRFGSFHGILIFYGITESLRNNPHGSTYSIHHTHTLHHIVSHRGTRTE